MSEDVQAQEVSIFCCLKRILDQFNEPDIKKTASLDHKKTPDQSFF